MSNKALMQLDPKTLRKHSQIVKAASNITPIDGKKIETETGYIIEGYKGSFETFFMAMAPGTVTPRYVHLTKDRVVRMHAGTADIFVTDVDGIELSRKFRPGQEIVLEKGKPYKISNTSIVLAEFFVTQPAKYDAKLETLEPGIGFTGEISQIVAEVPVPVERMPRRARTSKAAEQMAADAQLRGRSFPEPAVKLAGGSMPLNPKADFAFDPSQGG